MRPCWWSRTKAFLSSGNLTLFSCKFCAKKFYCFHPQHAALPRGCKLRIHVTSHVSQTPPFTRVEGAFQKSQEADCRRFFSLPSLLASSPIVFCFVLGWEFAPLTLLTTKEHQKTASYEGYHKQCFNMQCFLNQRLDPPVKKFLDLPLLYLLINDR